MTDSENKLDFDKNTRFLQQQIVDTRVLVLESNEQTRGAIREVSKAVVQLEENANRSFGLLAGEIGKLRKPLNGRLTLVTFVSITALGLAVACFIVI